MYLLDTNHCSKLIDRNLKIIKKLRELGDETLATCVVVKGELRFMVARSEQRVENDRKVSAFLNDIQILPVDGVVADEYAKIKLAILSKYGPKEKSAQRKTKIEEIGFSDNDIWIAAIANCNSLTVVTEDGDFTRIGQATSLKVENWI